MLTLVTCYSKQLKCITNYFNTRILHIFNTNVKAVLLYGCETQKNSKSITAKLQVFINKCLRKILRIYCPDQIMNKELWKRTKQPRIDLQIRKTQVGMAGPYTVKIIQCHSQASPRVESPRQMGQVENKEYMAKNGAGRGQRS